MVQITASASQASELASASRAGLVEAFERIRLGNFPQGRWLGMRNAYRSDTVQRIKADLEPSGTIKGRQLADYIAGSTVTHLGDGWGYLGRAVQALMLGDTSTTRHLAYYAELRAAMCLLAAQGIGVFDRQHFVLTGPDIVSPMTDRQSTHSFVWVALNWWACSPESKAVIEHFIRPAGMDLATWFSGLPAYGTWSLVAADWITTLGVDIQVVADDQLRRNEASYRPTRIVPSGGLAIDEETEFLAELWRVLEPSNGGFPVLEMHMLRLLVEKSFKVVEETNPQRAQSKFKSVVTSVTGAISDQSTASRAQDFLLRNVEVQDHPLFQHAAVIPDRVPSRDPRGMVSRAALLLALATGSTRQLMIETGTKLDDLQFWWAGLGAERGIWNAPPPAADLGDLWADFKIVLDDLDAWRSGPMPKARDSLLVDVPTAASRLAMLEIAALWGVAA